MQLQLQLQHELQPRHRLLAAAATRRAGTGAATNGRHLRLGHSVFNSEDRFSMMLSVTGVRCGDWAARVERAGAAVRAWQREQG